MEQHPVPQNVTTFQFRLIGDMTMKQFGYLAGGAILAYISFKLPLPFFFTWPLTVLFALTGIGFAFVPIEERPMDVWVLSFLKSVYNPTQFVWHRLQPTPTEVASRPTSEVTQVPSSQTSSTQQPASPIAATVRNFYTPQPMAQKTSPWSWLFSWMDKLFPTQKPKNQTGNGVVFQTIQANPTPATKPPTTVASNGITQQPIKKDDTITPVPPKELTDLQTKIDAMQIEINTKAQAELRVLELQKQMTDMLTQKQEMEQELMKLKTQQNKPQQPVITRPAGIITPTTIKGPTVKIIPPEAATRAGLPRLTTFTNVVTGIVKDNQGGLLPGVLVTVRDKDGIPLRALKTNKLGQFAASTQLPNGIYVIEIEDPRSRFTFDRAQVTLNGTVVPAIEIVAKSKRELDREMLAKQIFGQTNI